MPLAAPDLRYPYSPYFALLGGARRLAGASAFRVWWIADALAAPAAVVAPAALAGALCGPAAAAAAAPVALLLLLDANDLDRLAYPSRVVGLILVPAALAAAATFLRHGRRRSLAAAAALVALAGASHTVYLAHVALGLAALALGPGAEAPSRRRALLVACTAAVAPHLVLRLYLAARFPVLNPHYGTWREGVALPFGLGVAAPVMLLQPGVLLSLLVAVACLARPALVGAPFRRALVAGAALPLAVAFFPPAAALIVAASGGNFLNRVLSAAAPWGIAGAGAVAAGLPPRRAAAAAVAVAALAVGLAAHRAAVAPGQRGIDFVRRLERIEADGHPRLPVLAVARAAARERPDAVLALRPELAAFVPAFVDVRVAVVPEGWANPAADVAGRLADLDRALAGDTEAVRRLGATHVYRDPA